MDKLPRPSMVRETLRAAPEAPGVLAEEPNYFGKTEAAMRAIDGKISSECQRRQKAKSFLPH
jgi:hypothetical protein